jgi:urease alpha subunit
VAWAKMGDANASIPTPEPVLGRPMFGCFPGVVADNSFTFVSKISKDKVKTYGLKKRLYSVKNCRQIGKKDMKLNDYCPNISVDPETYQVKVEGREIQVAPAETVALSRNYCLF